jgi:hypothetical protein
LQRDEEAESELTEINRGRFVTYSQSLRTDRGKEDRKKRKKGGR